MVVYRDLVAKSLPNWLTLGGAIVFVVVKTLWLGGDALVLSVIGGLVTGLFLLVPFFLKAVGGGDVKLMFAVGILVGWPRALSVLFWVSVVGLAMGLGFALCSPAFWRRTRHAFCVTFNPFYDRAAGRAALGEAPPRRMAFGMPVAVGTLLAVMMPV